MYAQQGLGMPDLESHWLAERLAYLGRSLTGDAVWRRKASLAFTRLKSDPKAEDRRRLWAKHCLSASVEWPSIPSWVQ